MTSNINGANLRKFRALPRDFHICSKLWRPRSLGSFRLAFRQFYDGANAAECNRLDFDDSTS